MYLLPNEGKEIEFQIGKKALEEYVSDSSWKVNEGNYRIMFGTSSKEIHEEVLLQVLAE